jgi:hypothetical protein
LLRIQLISQATGVWVHLHDAAHWGGAAAGAFHRNGQPVNDLSTIANRNMLADHLFRGGKLR